MTRTDYELVAQALRCISDMGERFDVCSSMARVFANHSTRFNRVKFFKAAEVPMNYAEELRKKHDGWEEFRSAAYDSWKSKQ
jgi:hypothetical protein